MRLDEKREEEESNQIDQGIKSKERQPSSKVKRGNEKLSDNAKDLEENEESSLNQTDEDNEPEKRRRNDSDDIKDHLEKSLEEDIFKQG